MPLFNRPDGHYLRDVQPLRRILPFIMRGRNESVAYFPLDVELTLLRSFLDAANRERAEAPWRLFHVVVAALVRTLVLRPQLHRFVVGRRLYQRHELQISFAVKKEFSDEAPITTVKITFQPQDTLTEVARRLDEAICSARETAPTAAEREVSLLARLPRFINTLIFVAQRWLDAHNLLPAALIRDDPMYASVFVANLGSLGLDAPYHHLYEYGTIPFFCVIGQARLAPVVVTGNRLEAREVLPLRFTMDERIADGFYAARSLELFRSFLEKPKQLMAPSSANL
jgi:hypothetical protein